jgi:hypothetical protein
MKLNMKQTLAAALLLSTMIAGGSAQAQIAVDVDIDVGSITILYALSDISVGIDDTALGQLFSPAAGCSSATTGSECDEGTATGNATVNSGALEFAGGINPAALANVNAVSLVLQDVWAVRAIGGTSTNTTVAATLSGNTTLTGPNSSQINVSGITVPGATFADPGLGTPVSGNVDLTLDLSGVTSDGLHDGGALLYTIEVNNT